MAGLTRLRVQPTDILQQHYQRFTGRDPLARRLYADLKVSLPDEMLTKVDRMTMAVGLEARPPFLDHQLVEFSAWVPSRLKVRGRLGKYLLKKHAARLFPSSLVYRPKHCFSVPLDEWLRTDLRDFAYDMLTCPDSFTRDYFAEDRVEQILAWHTKDHREWGHHIWAMLMFELWGRMVVELPSWPRHEAAASI